jgi:hypothetical protein
MNKSTPKSCSCNQCKRGKHGGAKDLVRYDERKFRHAQKIALNKGVEEIQIAPKGNYYD